MERFSRPCAELRRRSPFQVAPSAGWRQQKRGEIDDDTRQLTRVHRHVAQECPPLLVLGVVRGECRRQMRNIPDATVTKHIVSSRRHTNAARHRHAHDQRQRLSDRPTQRARASGHLRLHRGHRLMAQLHRSRLRAHALHDCDRMRHGRRLMSIASSHPRLNLRRCGQRRRDVSPLRCDEDPCRQPFTAPALRPETKCRWTNMKRMIGGRLNRAAEAISEV